MLIVKVKEGNVEKALKALKHKVVKTKQLQELQARTEYVKPSVARRQEIISATYKQKKLSDYEKKLN
jgi:small subunit ribosomal protein S21